MTCFQDYPKEYPDGSKPLAEWLKEQVKKKDIWKRNMEMTIRGLFQTRPKIEFRIVRKNKREAQAIDELVAWFEKAEKEILGEEEQGRKK